MFWGFKVGDFSAHGGVEMRERIAVPNMDAMSQADDIIQIHKFLLDTKITEC
jgi:hypothetical protein